MAYLLNGSKEAAKQQVTSMFESDPIKGQALLHELCDHLFDPDKPFLQNKDFLDWIKVLFGEDVGYEAISNKVRNLDSSSLCGCVWTAHFIAYRCRTCATSPCMSLCASCFENGNHEGHDYNIFRSEAGGACDCGDTSVMDKSGFCSHHGPNRVIPPPPPQGFLAAGKILLDRMFLLLIQYLRNLSTIQESDSPMPLVFRQYLSFLLELIKLGSPVRSHVAQLLLDETLYSNLSESRGYQCLEDSNSSLSTFHKRTISIFDKAIEEIERPGIMNGIKDTGQFERCFQYKNYLDEITFWIVKYMFPEPLILIVLNLLPDATMKREFSRCFARHYTRIADSLAKSDDLDPLSNRVVHISVQLFSNDELAHMLCTQEHLLEIFMISMHNIISPSLVRSSTHEGDMHYCVSCASNVMKGNVYWPIVSDLVNMLGHEKVAVLLLKDQELLQCWFQEVLGFCGMALNKRALISHVEFEPDSNQMLIAFYTEREACASPLWCLIAVLKDRSTIDLSYEVIGAVLVAIQDFLDALGMTETLAPPFNQISFHYPLHRYLAHFVSNTIRNQGATLESISVSDASARLIIMHPLQVLICSFEVQCAMWIRNGLHMASQSLAHKQYFFSKFFMDADLFLIQFCSCILPPHYVVALLAQRCRVLSCLAISDVPLVTRYTYPHGGEKGEPTDEKLYKMFEAFFTILQYIIAVNCMKDLNEEELFRNEAICLLTTRSSTYSSLTEHTPQTYESQTGLKNTSHVSTLHRVLDAYAVKKEGAGMEQTKFEPNAEAWKLYDPVFSQYRSLYQRDVQKAHSNYVQFLQETNVIDSSVTETNLWPPYQPIHNLPRDYRALAGLVRSRLLHAFIFTALHNEAIVTDITLSVCLHLLDTALRLRSDTDSALSQEYFDQSWCDTLLNFYDVDDVLRNIIKIVSFRKHTVPDVAEEMPTDAASEKIETVYTGESIVSLLLKLYDKLSGSKGSFVLDPGGTNSVKHPSTRLNVISNLLHSASSMSKEVEQMIRVIIKSLAPHPSVSDTQLSSSESAMDARNKRRQKAKEAQERLMKQFAIEQKKFLQSSETMEVDDEDVTEMDASVSSSEPNALDPADWGLHSFVHYECVICASSETELQVSGVAEEQAGPKMMGLICLAQPSCVLGHRTTDSGRSTPYSPGKRPPSCYSNTVRARVLRQNIRLQTLIDASKLRDDLFVEQNIFATAIGTHLSTCGHHVHLDCHSKYMETVRNQGRSQIMYDMIRAFQCPLCRQVSNVVLPCNLRTKQRNLSGEADYRTLISKAWLDTLSDLTCVNETDTLGAIVGRASRGLGLVMPLVTLVRYNLEVTTMLKENHLLQSRDAVGPLTRAQLVRRSPIDSLFVLLHWMWQVGDAKEMREKNNASVALTRGRLCGTEGAQFHYGDTPLLMLDSVTLFIRLLLDSPTLVADFQENVGRVYNLVFVQAILEICFKFSPEERRAWSNSVGSGEFSSGDLDCLVSSIIHLLPGQLFDSSLSSSQTSLDASNAFSSTVFTQQSVFGAIERQLLHFLRIASILQHAIFPHMKLPSFTPTSQEFGSLAACLGLCSERDAITTDTLQCLTWSEPQTLVTRWCSEVSHIVQFSQDTSRKLLAGHRLWPAPKLIKLPREYSSLFQMYRMKPCPSCGVVPKEPVLCLVCGEYFCSKSLCDKNRDNDSNSLLTLLPLHSMRGNRDLYSCTRHARNCGAGTSVFLQVNTSFLVVIRGNRACIWGTLYLDAHGEEDRGWRRGRPLFLKKERLELLEHQWLNHLFDNAAKDWSPHRNLL